VPSIDLSTLSEHAGQRVSVGGLVVDLLPDGFSLDDGSATGRIVLTQDATAYLDLIEPGDALQVLGRVDVGSPDGARLIVDAAADVVRVGDPGDPGAVASTDPSPGPSETAVSPAWDPPVDRAATVARSAGLGGFPDPTVLGAGWLAVMAGMSVAVTFVRRRRARRVLAARVAARLAQMAGPRGSS
jgi:hypothetical protein